MYVAPTRHLKQALLSDAHRALIYRDLPMSLTLGKNHFV